MILFLHLVFLAYTTYKVAFLNRKGMRYRPLYSALAYMWAGSSAVLIAMIVSYWPQAVSHANALTCMAVGSSAGLAWWCGGNVACLARKLADIRFAI